MEIFQEGRGLNRPYKYPEITKKPNKNFGVFFKTYLLVATSKVYLELETRFIRKNFARKKILSHI